MDINFSNYIEVFSSDFKEKHYYKIEDLSIISNLFPSYQQEEKVFYIWKEWPNQAVLITNKRIYANTSTIVRINSEIVSNIIEWDRIKNMSMVGECLFVNDKFFFYIRESLITPEFQKNCRAIKNYLQDLCSKYYEIKNISISDEKNIFCIQNIFYNDLVDICKEKKLLALFFLKENDNTLPSYITNPAFYLKYSNETENKFLVYIYKYKYHDPLFDRMHSENKGIYIKINSIYDFVILYNGRMLGYNSTFVKDIIQLFFDGKDQLEPEEESINKLLSRTKKGLFAGNIFNRVDNIMYTAGVLFIIVFLTFLFRTCK